MTRRSMAKADHRGKRVLRDLQSLVVVVVRELQLGRGQTLGEGRIVCAPLG